MDVLIFHLGVKEEKNVHVDDFIVVVQTEFQRHVMPIKESAVTLHMEQKVSKPLEYTIS